MLELGRDQAIGSIAHPHHVPRSFDGNHAVSSLAQAGAPRPCETADSIVMSQVGVLKEHLHTLASQTSCCSGRLSLSGRPSTAIRA